MTAFPSTQDTTATYIPVTLPALSARGWRNLVATLEGQHPDELGRLRRGVETLRHKRVLEAQDGTYLVESSVPDQYYRCSTARCTCPDALQREVRC